MANNTDKKKEAKKFATVEAQKVATKGVVIVAILGLVGAGINAWVNYSSNKIPINATQTAEARFTEIALSATLPPTKVFQGTITTPPSTTAPSLSEPIIPANYDSFDDFTGNGSIDTNIWVAVSKPENCSNQQGNGFLNIVCETSSGDVNLGFMPADENLRKVSGVALASEVLTDDYKGSLDLNITFKGENDELRVYFLQLRYGEFKVAEAYPQDNFRSVDLVRLPVDSGKPHIVRAEYHAGLFTVWVDDTHIQMQPNLPNNAVWLDWKIEPYLACVSCNKGLLETNIFWTAILPTEIANSSPILLYDNFDDGVRDNLWNTSCLSEQAQESGGFLNLQLAENQTATWVDCEFGSNLNYALVNKISLKVTLNQGTNEGWIGIFSNCGQNWLNFMMNSEWVGYSGAGISRVAIEQFDGLPITRTLIMEWTGSEVIFSVVEAGKTASIACNEKPSSIEIGVGTNPGAFVAGMFDEVVIYGSP